jgi:hypothetical protein
MTLISNSIFQSNPLMGNIIKFKDGDLVVNNGANTLANLDMCSIKVNYKQYQKLSVIVPAGQTNYLLHFPMMGIEITFLAIKPTYCGTTIGTNYLKWKFQTSSDPKWSMTSTLVLTGTTTNPIPPISIDNPNMDCPLQLDILVSGMDNDYINDHSAFLYLNDLVYSNIQTTGQTNSGVLAFYNYLNQLIGTVDIADVINVSRVAGLKRIVIDESSTDNIVLDFNTEYDTLQALSALSWLLEDPTNRYLPQPIDIVGPVINTTFRVVSNTITIDLSTFSNNYTKQQFLNDSILSIVDARDGVITPSIVNVTFTQGTPIIEYITLNNPGTYIATVTISDIAGNITTKIINIIAQSSIVDTTPPVITFSGNVTGSVISTIDINNYLNHHFTYNDARLLCITGVSDNIDNVIPINNVGVTFFDINMVPVVSPLFIEGDYFVQFSITDSHNNTTTRLLSLHINNTLIDTAPAIKYTTNLNAILMTATISLSVNYGSGVGIFNKIDANNRFIQQVTDDIDGTIITSATNISIFDNIPTSISSITTIGIYTIRFTITDTGLNTTIKTLTLTVTT